MVVRLLLKYGACPNLLDLEQETALHVAAKAHNFETFKLLVEAGGKVTSLGDVKRKDSW